MLTDAETIKALECCSGFERCRECPLFEFGNRTCTRQVQKAALDLINRQKAEVERLEADLRRRS